MCYCRETWLFCLHLHRNVKMWTVERLITTLSVCYGSRTGMECTCQHGFVLAHAHSPCLCVSLGSKNHQPRAKTVACSHLSTGYSFAPFEWMPWFTRRWETPPPTSQHNSRQMAASSDQCSERAMGGRARMIVHFCQLWGYWPKAAPLHQPVHNSCNIPWGYVSLSFIVWFMLFN